ncbi:hypothetical protein [Streptomyces sp. Y7]|uniref:hypothetical protein n=1 Tax=Streptomyces sp. Y7 TaxID=3342392 RepID=UPI00371AB8E8
MKASDDLAGRSDLSCRQILMQRSGTFEARTLVFGPEGKQGYDHRCQCQDR